MLSVQHLTVAYTATPVFKDLSVDFAPGHITGIIGPNGAGKSTLIKAMLNLQKAQTGTTEYNQAPLVAHRQQIAYVEQRKELDLTFPISVFDVVLSGTYARVGVLKTPGKAEREAAHAALAQVDLADFAKRQIGGLSGGQLQRVFVARAIVQQADVIILDEPFVGIDMPSVASIMAILHQWRDAGKTIIVVHHDLNQVSDYFDDLVILNHGVVAAGPTNQVYTAKNIAAAFSQDLSQVLFTEEAQ